MFLQNPSHLSSDLSIKSPPGCLTTVLFCPTANSWPLFPHTDCTGHWTMLPSADFSSRTSGFQLGGEEATAEVWPARPGWQSSSTMTGQLLAWRTAGLALLQSLTGDWSGDCSSGFRRFKVDKENYFQGIVYQFRYICTYISNFILF